MLDGVVGLESSRRSFGIRFARTFRRPRANCALRLIVERELLKFARSIAVEYSTIHAMLNASDRRQFEFRLHKYKGEDLEISNEAAAQKCCTTSRRTMEVARR